MFVSFVDARYADTVCILSTFVLDGRLIHLLVDGDRRFLSIAFPLSVSSIFCSRIEGDGITTSLLMCVYEFWENRDRRMRIGDHRQVRHLTCAMGNTSSAFYRWKIIVYSNRRMHVVDVSTRCNTSVHQSIEVGHTIKTPIAIPVPTTMQHNITPGSSTPIARGIGSPLCRYQVFPRTASPAVR